MVYGFMTVRAMEMVGMAFWKQLPRKKLSKVKHTEYGYFSWTVEDTEVKK